jgi:uncharacterized protein (TIGR04255 family)
VGILPLTFPDHPDVVFERAPLLVVLCQVKYPPILSLLTAAGVAGFQEAIRDLYPVLQPEAGAQIELGPGGLAVSEKSPVWRMSSQDESWRVSVATDMAALEAFSYTSIDDFADRLAYVLEALRRTVRPEPSTRLGLRKVNDIEHPDVADPVIGRDGCVEMFLGYWVRMTSMATSHWPFRNYIFRTERRHSPSGMAHCRRLYRNTG